jgi:hypothetical protein
MIHSLHASRTSESAERGRKLRLLISSVIVRASLHSAPPCLSNLHPRLLYAASTPSTLTPQSSQYSPPPLYVGGGRAAAAAAEDAAGVQLHPGVDPRARRTSRPLRSQAPSRQLERERGEAVHLRVYVVRSLLSFPGLSHRPFAARRLPRLRRPHSPPSARPTESSVARHLPATLSGGSGRLGRRGAGATGHCACSHVSDRSGPRSLARHGRHALPVRRDRREWRR